MGLLQEWTIFFRMRKDGFFIHVSSPGARRIDFDFIRATRRRMGISAEVFGNAGFFEKSDDDDIGASLIETHRWSRNGKIHRFSSRLSPLGAKAHGNGFCRSFLFGIN